MTSSLFETTIGAFEERMALRRKMLSVTGIMLPKRRIPQDVEDEIRDSIINCYECKSGDTCATWLATAADGVPPPEFCPNRDSILRLKADGYSMEPGV
ncbi:DUF6455 family protein [uncultured Sulfitobacter sp.]|uniref:DUF6455 family protein n=1 Tax=uncultured Sulfitobacter sp. TaxID=191468 RepID=UPI0030D90818|tara:strand:- start:130689 stop:130982 length:294 start_codon:yes stop_codon:yes gene_type:complete